MIYNDKKIIIYLTENNQPYFDINHVINLLDDKNKKNKYSQYNNEIKLFNFRNNEHG